MGPLEAVKPWSMKGVEGVYRFLGRVWRLIVDAEADEIRLDPRVQDVAADAPSRPSSSPGPSPRDRRPRGHAVQHGDQPADGVRQRLHRRRRSGRGRRWRRSCCCSRRSPRTSPRSCGRSSATTETLAYEPWPTLRPGAAEGRRDRGAGPGQRQAPRQGRRPGRRRSAAIEAAARADERIIALLEGKTIRKVVVVPGKLVNFVVG